MIPKVGDKVEIKIPGLEPMMGIVKEIDDCSAGGEESSFDILLDTGGSILAYESEITIIEDNIEEEPSESKDELIMVKTIDIHKIIDDAMEKKDRAVHILILPTSTSVNVTPYDDKPRSWLPDGRHNVKCPECGKTRHIPTVYCPECGEKLVTPEGY